MTPVYPIQRDLPTWLWLWLPLAIIAALYITRAVNLNIYLLMKSEMGVIENLTIIFLIVAVITGILLFRQIPGFPVRWFKWWVVLISVGCFYFAGEELSWGQHYIGWTVPDTWAQLNDQSETNLHNTSELFGFLFDNLPRFLLTLAALIGGIIAPVTFLVRKKPLSFTSANYWLWPTYVCIPVSVLAVTITIPTKIIENTDITLGVFSIGMGEAKECMLAMFLMLYLWSVYVRWKEFKRLSPVTSVKSTDQLITSH